MLLQEWGELQVNDLVQRFGVSGMTIRRDLQDLADEGKLIRTHGGVAKAVGVSFEFRFLDRARHHAKQKGQIADYAAKLVEPDMSVLLDSSTTTLAIARRLRTMSSLTIVTTSLPIASEMFGQEAITTILLGGTLRNNSPDLFGAITDQNLEWIRADLAFIGADAVGLDGHVYNASAELARMLEKMARAADRRYLVADHSKIGHHKLMRFGNLREWAGLITDEGIQASARQALADAGVGVIIAESEEAAAVS